MLGGFLRSVGGWAVVRPASVSTWRSRATIGPHPWAGFTLFKSGFGSAFHRGPVEPNVAHQKGMLPIRRKASDWGILADVMDRPRGAVVAIAHEQDVACAVAQTTVSTRERVAEDLLAYAGRTLACFTLKPLQRVLLESDRRDILR